MSRTGPLDMVRVDELRRVLRLVNELRDLPRGSEAQRRHALEGLASLVGAKVGLWSEISGVSTGRVVIQNVLDVGWADSKERALFRSYVQEGQRTSEDPSLPRFAAMAHGPVCTFSREQLVDDRTWYGSEHVQELRRPGDSDDFIYTADFTSGDQAHCISLHRPWGERRFSERERQLVEVFHEECRFLHRSPEVPAARLVGLAPRLQDTLRGLARGLSEKQIAAELRLSQHTVHDYVKTLHRHFGVASRSELLALCLTSG